jgi:hypothetical protein
MKNFYESEQLLASSKILTPHPLSTQRVCPPPAPKAEGVHTRRAVRGWGVNILEDAKHRIGLLQYNLSTLTAISAKKENILQTIKNHPSLGECCFIFNMYIVQYYIVHCPLYASLLEIFIQHKNCCRLLSIDFTYCSVMYEEKFNLNASIKKSLYCSRLQLVDF